MPKRNDKWYRVKAYNVLSHAILHCVSTGYEPDRIPDEADLTAAKTLLECRQEVIREDIELDIIEGRT